MRAISPSRTGSALHRLHCEPVVRRTRRARFAGARDGKAPSPALRSFGGAARRDLLPIQSLRQRGADPGRAGCARGPAAGQSAAHRGNADRRRPGDQGTGGLKMLAELGHDVSALGVAKYYQRLVDGFVLDAPGCRPRARNRAAVASSVKVADTMMHDDLDKKRAWPLVVLRIRGRDCRRWATLTGK